MLLNKMKKILCVLMVALISASIFAAAPDLTDRYLEKADAAYEDGNIPEAYKYVNMALSVNKKPESSADLLYTAQSIYKQMLEDQLKNYDSLLFIEITTNLEKYPTIANSTIKKLVRQVEQLQEEKKLQEDKEFKERQTKADEEMREAQKETANAMRAQTQALKEQTETTQKNQDELKSALSSGFNAMKESSDRAASETKNAISKVIYIVIAIIVLILLIVLVIVIIAHKGFKHQEIQQEQYIQAFKMLATTQNQTNRLMLGGVTDLYREGGQLKLAGSSKWVPVAALPDVEQTPEEKEEIAQIAAKCEDIGAKIDQVTGRKNNSKNVSELVYKLAIQLGLPQGEAMLYFCAAMIYDAGFLGIDEELFTTETLTDDQKKAMHEHVNLAEKHLDFIPKKYWQVFEDAAICHHENMDGSGYPKGLKGDKIPQIARLIRVAETFISMSSKRGYREIMDKETAIQKLRDQPELYDADVVDVLEMII